jgi:hypothetical protein
MIGAHESTRSGTRGGVMLIACVGTLPRIADPGAPLFCTTSSKVPGFTEDTVVVFP